MTGVTEALNECITKVGIEDMKERQRAQTSVTLTRTTFCRSALTVCSGSMRNRI